MICSREYDYFTDRTGLSALFQVFQNVSAVHCKLLGRSPARLYQDNLIWVVVRHCAKITRLPAAGEHIRVQTWIGGTKHGMFPRYYRLYSADGEELALGGALWAMVDAGTRKMVNPDSFGLSMEGDPNDPELQMPTLVKKLPVSGKCGFAVPDEFVDENGHMNNTHYYDAAENSIAAETAGLSPVEVRTSFIAELPQGKAMELHWGSENGLWYISGESDHPIFKMNIRYE